jgi:hypothetical protein
MSVFGEVVVKRLAYAARGRREFFRSMRQAEEWAAKVSPDPLVVSIARIAFKRPARHLEGQALP